MRVNIMTRFSAEIQPEVLYHLHIDFQWSHVVALGNLKGLSLQVLQQGLYIAYSTSYSITGFDNRDLKIVFEQYGGTPQTRDASPNNADMRGHAFSTRAEVVGVVDSLGGSRETNDPVGGWMADMQQTQNQHSRPSLPCEGRSLDELGY